MALSQNGLSHNGYRRVCARARVFAHVRLRCVDSNDFRVRAACIRGSGFRGPCPHLEGAFAM
eukprot:11213363-Lingulodinium_polyedra.AAC.1